MVLWIVASTMPHREKSDKLRGGGLVADVRDVVPEKRISIGPRNNTQSILKVVISPDGPWITPLLPYASYNVSLAVELLVFQDI